MKDVETTRVKKKMGDYGYKMYSLPEKVMSVAKVLSTRDHLSYGEVITDALELYIARYPGCRLKGEGGKIDMMLKTLDMKTVGSPVELDI